MKFFSNDAKKILFILVFGVIFAFPNMAYAGYWGENIQATFLKEALEKISRNLEGIMLGAFKSSAATVINSQIGQLIGGSGAEGGQIISDWRKWLREVPDQKVKNAHDEFFASLGAGRTSSNYQPASSGSSKNYYDMLAEQERSLNQSMSESAPRANAADILGGDPIERLGEGDMRAFNALLDGTNNPFSITLAHQKTMQDVREAAQQEQVVKSIASGFKPVEGADGKVTLPIGAVNSIFNNAQDIGNKIIAGASNPGELASGVAVAMANKMITGYFKKGIGDIQSKIQNEVRQVDREVSSIKKSINKELGPASDFLREVKQQTDAIEKAGSGSGSAVPKSLRL